MNILANSPITKTKNDVSIITKAIDTQGIRTYTILRLSNLTKEVTKSSIIDLEVV